MKKWVLLLLITNLVTFLFSYNKGKRTEVNEYKKIDPIVSDSFLLGCEVASSKFCTSKNLNSCKAFCFSFAKDNKDVLDLSKKKAEAILSQ